MSAITVNVASTSNKFQKGYNEQFFEDGIRIIDYILVYNDTIEDQRRKVFFSSLQEIGIELERTYSVIDPEIVFIKVHVPKILIFQYAEKYDIPIKKLQKSYIRPPIPHLKCLRTELTSQDVHSPNFARAPGTLSGNKPMHCLRNERILVTYNILKRVVFGPNKSKDIGIHHLVNREILVAAFPPHDGTSKWDNHPTDPINDRQLLRKYWSDPKNFFKTQPLDVIEQYFGDNIALYFAWLSFYNKMLIGPIIIGLIVTALNWAYLSTHPISVQEACNSTILMCPICRKCKVWMLKNSCLTYKLAYVTDNNFTIAFAIVMSFWAAIYMVLWMRKQAVLTLRWNIRDSNMEEQDIRPEFENFAKFVRISELGEPELYISVFTQIWRKTISVFCTVLMAAILIYVHILMIIFEIEISTQIPYFLVGTLLSSILSILTIMVLRRVCISVFEPVVIWLVNLEVPQTQTDYDNSYILKVFLFSFFNNYTSLIYIAFFKGKFYTHPNDPRIYEAISQLSVDTCDPSGCISELHISFQIFLTFLPLLNQFTNTIYTYTSMWCKRSKERRARIIHTNIPRWEKDYELSEAEPYDLLKLYEEMVVQFGFVTLFAFAFPAAPVIALIHNLIKIHVDSHNLVVKQRRPQAKRTASVGAWLDIMHFLAYCSIFTNAYYMTFTSDFIPKSYYLHTKNDNLGGFVKFTLSGYIIDLDKWPNANVPNGTTCFYHGFRNPPDHYLPYELSFDHYCMLAIKVAVILVFEHMVWALTSVLTYSIPTIPSVVREKYAVETMELRKYLASKPSISSESITRVREKK